MRFRIQWEESPDHELAKAWLDADSLLRAAITQAIARIERELSRDPYQRSESRENGRRVLIEAPIGIVFRVDDGDRVVYILRCWCFTKRKTDE